MSEKKKCFIIQPLSDKYIKRCDDTYKPAIEEAGLVHYRVDEDYHAIKLKINVIKEEIQKAAVCLADITEDNPNVWYEVGFADGQNIPVVMICEELKRETLPFDINQRDINFYGTSSQSDWQKLRQEITNRLKIAITEEQSSSGEKDTVIHTNQDVSSDELEPAELTILWFLYYGAQESTLLHKKAIIRGRMINNFHQDDITDAFSFLEKKKMIRFASGSCYYITKKGIGFCLENKELVRGARI